MKVVWYPSPNTIPESTGTIQGMLDLADQASQKRLIVRQGADMQDIGSRWASGPDAHRFPTFLALL